MDNGQTKFKFSLLTLAILTTFSSVSYATTYDIRHNGSEFVFSKDGGIEQTLVDTYNHETHSTTRPFYFDKAYGVQVIAPENVTVNIDMGDSNPLFASPIYAGTIRHADIYGNPIYTLQNNVLNIKSGKLAHYDYAAAFMFATTLDDNDNLQEHIATKNTVNITGGSSRAIPEGSVFSPTIYGGHAYKAVDNTINMTAGNHHQLVGGAGVFAEQNQVNVSGGRVGTITGGDAVSIDVNNLNQETIKSKEHHATKNKVRVTGDTIVESNIIGGDAIVGFYGFGTSITPPNYADNNEVYFEAQRVGGDIIGGYGYVANSNKVEVKSGEINGYVNGAYSTAYRDPDTQQITYTQLNQNQVIISGGEFRKAISGARLWSGVANQNTVKITGGLINNSVYGAMSDSLVYAPTHMQDNQVSITNAEINGNMIAGAYSIDDTQKSTATGNKVSITKGTKANVNNVYGGFGDIDVNQNEVSVSSTNSSISFRDNTKFYGGYATDGNANENKVSFSTGGVKTADLYGGYSEKGDVENNSITTTNWASINNAFAGYTENGNAIGNSIDLNAFVYGDSVIAGYANNGRANENKIYAAPNSSQAFAGRLIGGLSVADDGAEASGNTLEIINGKYTEDAQVVAGLAQGKNAKANNNKILLQVGVLAENVIAGQIVGDNDPNSTSELAYNNITKNNLSGTQYNNLIAAYTDSYAVAHHNSVDINHSHSTINGNVIAANSRGYVHDNVVNITNIKEISRNVIGGHSWENEANDNQVNIDINANNKKAIIQTVNAGRGTSANRNQVNINNATIHNVEASIATNGNANDSVVNLNGGNVERNVIAGISLKDGDANNNTINANGTDVPDIVAGTSTDGNANNNNVNLVSGKLKIVTAGRAANGYANENKVNITGDDKLYVENVIAGEGVVADKNEVVLEKGEINGDIIASHAIGRDSRATNSIVRLKGGKTTGDVYGGYSENGYVINNTVELTGNENANQVYGGYTENGEAIENTVNVNGGNAEQAFAGYTKTGDANRNTINLVSGSLKQAVAGYSGKGNATYNTIYINGKNIVNDDVVGGVAGKEASCNQVFVNQDNTGNVIGGVADQGNAHHNTIFLNGGKVGGDVIAGRSNLADAIDNIVNFNAGEVGGTILGGFAPSGEQKQGNTLNVGSGDRAIKMNTLKAGNIANFAQINFYLPTDNIKYNDTALELTAGEETDLNGTTVSAYLRDASNLSGEGKIHLIKSNGTIREFDDSNGDKTKVAVNVANLINVQADIVLTDAQHLDLSFIGDQPPTQPTPTPTPTPTQPTPKPTPKTQPTPVPTPTPQPMPKPKASANDNAEHILHSDLVNMAMANQGGDLLTGFLENIKPSEDKSIYPFANVAGFNKRYTTGSHIEIDSGHFNIGMGSNNEFNSGNLNTGAFFEYGKGNFNSYLDNFTQTSGKVHYYGGGLFAKYKLANGFYGEGIARVGEVKSKTNRGLYDAYTIKTPYFGIHTGAGYLADLNNQQLDTYAHYDYTHTNKDSFRLHGVDVNVAAVNYSRIRLGVRDTFKLNDKNQLYVGAAYQNVFDGKANGDVSAFGQTAHIKSPKLKGSTGIGELGYKYTNGALEFNLSAKGYVGKEKGVSGHAEMKYNF